MSWEIQTGDVLERLVELPDDSVQCVVTSPPYWGLRDYGTGDAQIGLEPSFDEYVAKMVEVFREVRRVLRPDGVLWLNLGDSYSGAGKTRGDAAVPGTLVHGQKRSNRRDGAPVPRTKLPGLKPKDLIGIPWRVAFALQGDGWWLRSDVIWAKPNPMPESVRDRPTKSHEYVFLLSKSHRYFYDADAIREGAKGDHPRTVDHQPEPSNGLLPPHTGLRKAGLRKSGNKERTYQRDIGRPGRHGGDIGRTFPWEGTSRNARTVWTIATQPFPGAHFATFPEELPRRCIGSGSRDGDLVLDPFAGAGTTGVVALRMGRAFVGIELSEDYSELARKRIHAATLTLPSDGWAPVAGEGTPLFEAGP